MEQNINFNRLKFQIYKRIKQNIIKFLKCKKRNDFCKRNCNKLNDIFKIKISRQTVSYYRKKIDICFQFCKIQYKTKVMQHPKLHQISKTAKFKELNRNLISIYSSLT
ncbi:hypothetical protein BpHYR1_052599 [Brachionus plicatilis]|uniref:Uncharacterized protein n=1 Tax=Brachionus plicatilis TaxID=10195 RepID=A0A3M7Q2E2_BRAPC|nr:hypothetical protein BpHYR1_052599 [Brachionus plicatilis]